MKSGFPSRNNKHNDETWKHFPKPNVITTKDYGSLKEVWFTNVCPWGRNITVNIYS